VIRVWPYDIVDFSGGLTDNYIGAPNNRYYQADNLLVTRTGKMVTRYGSSFFDADNPLVTDPSNERVNTLINIDNGENLLAHSIDKIYEYNSGWTVVASMATTSFDPPTVYTEKNYLSYSISNDQLYFASSEISSPRIIYKDISGTIQNIQAGIGPIYDYRTRNYNINITTERAYTAGANTYLYAIVYRLDYLVFPGTSFRIDSTPIIIEVENAAAFPMAVTPNFWLGPGPIPFANLPAAPVVLDIYRTTANGSIFYYLQTSDITDLSTPPNYLVSSNVDDSFIVNNALLYTEGDALPYDAAPDCKFVHIVGGTGYYANIADYVLFATPDDVLYQPDTIQISVPGIPWACPRLLRVRVGEEITGLSSADDVPLVFCKKSIFRLDGQFDETGRGAVIPQRLSANVGCLSNQSIVKISGGTFFAGTDGFYFTDGYNLQKISSEINERYLSYTQTSDQKERIQGAYDATNQRIIWSIQSDNGVNSDVDICLVLDLNFGIKPDSCFTSMSGGDSFAPSALIFHKGNLLRGDKRGYLFEHLPSLRRDLEVDVNIAPSDWRGKTILYNYTSPAFDFGENMLRKWVPMINVMAKNESPLSLQIRSNNDDNGKIADLSPIRFRGFVTWGDEEVIWGDPDIIWNFDGVIAAKRHFPAKGIRCSLKQVIMTNATVIVENSDVNGNATVDSGTKEVTLDQVNATWPGNVVEYFIAFENDSYEQQFQIIDRISDTVIEIDDPLNILPIGATSYKWQLYGKPIDERLNLISYTIHAAPLSKTQETYRAGSQGANNA